MVSEHALVTGAGGYIGRHVVTALLDRGCRVTATRRPPARMNIDERAPLVHADVLDRAFDIRMLAAEPPTVAVHLAWQDGFSHNAPSHMLLLSAHFRLLAGLVEWGVQRVSALGSMHEVGYWEGSIDADTPTNPATLYWIAKNALRKAVFTSSADRNNLTWLLCFYVYGDDRHSNSIFTRLLEAVKRANRAFHSPLERTSTTSSGSTSSRGRSQRSPRRMRSPASSTAAPGSLFRSPTRSRTSSETTNSPFARTTVGRGSSLRFAWCLGRRDGDPPAHRPRWGSDGADHTTDSHDRTVRSNFLPGRGSRSG